MAVSGWIGGEEPKKKRDKKMAKTTPVKATPNREQLFLYELLMDRVERSLLKALHANANDEATRNAYVDYLLDQGRTESAEMVRAGHIPAGYVYAGWGSGAIGSGQIGTYNIGSGR